MIQENVIENKILNFAQKDSRIRAVILNGSRANPLVHPDTYQDFDIIFIVKDFDSLLKERSWLKKLGTPLLQQVPDEMVLGNEFNQKQLSFSFLTIFEGDYRIDLTLFPIDQFESDYKSESLSLVWIDKDNLFQKIAVPSDSDYHISKPTEREFREVCNEFWWTITNVAKGLKREELISAKYILENIVRPMFWKLMEWNVGFQYD